MLLHGMVVFWCFILAALSFGFFKTAVFLLLLSGLLDIIDGTIARKKKYCVNAGDDL